MAITFLGSVANLIALGNSETTQNLFLIENRKGSRVNMNIRRLVVTLDPIAVLSTFMPIVKVSRASNVTAGAIIKKSNFDTTQTSDSNVVLSGPIQDAFSVQATPGTIIWQRMVSRLASAAEQVSGFDKPLLPTLVANSGQEFKLRPGESLVVQVVAAAGTSNAASTNNWFVECVWEEDDIGTFSIAGQVTLSAVPVSGAKIIVIEADDTSLTNPTFVGVETSDGSGNWSANITSGRVGAAFVQYESGGTYYTAPGNPFLEP